MECKMLEWEFCQKLARIRYYLDTLSGQGDEPPNVQTNEARRTPSDHENDSSLDVHRVPPKEEYGELLHAETTVSEMGSVPSSTTLKFERRRKKRKKTIDPLRPTKKTSFGVDIGQGINTINFIKENCCPLTDMKKGKLLGLFTKPVIKTMSERSLDNFYRQGPISQESSQANIIVEGRTDDERTVRVKVELMDVFDQSLFSLEDYSMYKIRYRQVSPEIPHDYGLDELQSLFVPHHTT